MNVNKHEEYTDNVISYQFHVQSHLNRHYYNYYCEISYIHVQVWLKVFQK